jgi:peptide-methionine (S)-S-oxide reductase
VNRQGPDVGPSYRSAIFPQNAGQRAYAARFIAQLRKSGIRAATRVESGTFYPAEASHQDFMRRNPNHPYIVAHDRPKLAKLKRSYPRLWKA